MFKCDLCDKKMEMGEGQILHDKFRNKNVMYCCECFHEYEDASALWKDKKELEKSKECKLLRSILR